jgi:hypothetical protein
MTDNVGSTAYWFVGGNDTYSGGWLNIILYTGSTPDVGTVDFANLTEIGISHRNGLKDGYLSDPKAGDNVWIDYIRHSDGLVCYGTNWNIRDAAIIDQAPGVGFGIIQGENSVIEISGSLTYGKLTEPTVYSDDGVTMVFSNKVVRDGLYGMKFIGDQLGTSEFEITNSVILSDFNKYYLDLDDPNIYKLTLTANLISGAGEIHLLNNIMYSNVTANLFNKCGAIHPQGCRFENNSINSTTADVASLYLKNYNEVNATKDIIYTKYFNKYALYLDAAVSGTIVLDAHIFDGTGIDIYWAGTVGTLTIKLVNNSNASSFNTAGGDIEFVLMDNIAIDYGQVEVMLNTSNQQLLDVVANSNENINQLLIAMGNNISENKSVIISKSGNTQLSL